MKHTASSAHLPPLGSHVREEVGGTLQASLVELVDLALVGKQLHWSVVGPHFRTLHLRLDELVDSWRELADTVAERAVALDYWPNGQAGALVAAESGTGIEQGPVGDRDVLRELARRLAEIVERIRTRMDRLGELDLVSQDVLIEVLRALEEQLWMTRAELEQPE
jgi:starvation-inducible DNA-binding protein